VLTLDDEEQQPAFRFWVDETAAPVTPAGGIG